MHPRLAWVVLPHCHCSCQLAQVARVVAPGCSVRYICVRRTLPFGDGTIIENYSIAALYYLHYTISFTKTSPRTYVFAYLDLSSKILDTAGVLTYLLEFLVLSESDLVPAIGLTHMGSVVPDSWASLN